MPTHTLLRECHLPDDEISRELDEVFGPDADDWLAPESQPFLEDRVVTGRVVQVGEDAVRVDVGYKSDGMVPLREWFDDKAQAVIAPRTGDVLEFVLVSAEGDDGGVVLSHRRARHEAAWKRFAAEHKTGDDVSGKVVRRVAGGLLVDVGVTAFLPASQVDVRRPRDVGEYVGRDVECEVLTIDPHKRSVVLSRRALLTRHQAVNRVNVLAQIEAGQVRRGVVKNVADFGAFVDLGGIDGLLHVSDLSWGRVRDARSFVQVEQALEVYVLNVDRERERISLSLKHLTPSPWADLAQRYPVGSRHEGEVANVTGYGAFVELEPGVEGLVHVSEMSWTRRISQPSELVRAGDRITVQVLKVDEERKQLSLGMKQLTADPWAGVAGRYAVNAVVEGAVRSLTNYGAFVELEEGVQGMIHVSDMGWRRDARPGDLLRLGDRVSCLVLDVDEERRRIALGLKQLTADPWQGVEGRYVPGAVARGKVTKLANFGVFVELEPGLEGLLHASEMGEGGVEAGAEVEVTVLRVDVGERKIGLTRRR
jgi:small subunit ribosomal protein S1